MKKEKDNQKRNKTIILAKLGFGILILILLSAMFVSYYNSYQEKTTLQSILKNPEKYDGVYYQTSGRISRTTDSFVYILDTEANMEIPVLYAGHYFKPGNNAVFYGSMTKDGYMIAAKSRLQNSEPFKYLISLIAGVIFLFLFFKEWKLSWNGFQERERDF